MSDSYRKISRGQVWFLVDNDVPAVHTQGSVVGKNRPWLVVSNNKCNQASPVYTIVPLTTASKTELPTHVTFNVGDKPQTIMCEQIRTVSQQVFFNSGSYYKWTMSEKYMAMVDEALAIQLDLSLIFPNSERFWESLERLIRVKVKQAISDTKVEAVDISKISSLLEASIDKTLESEPKPETPIEKKETKPAEPKKDWVPTHNTSKMNRWTDEEKRKFLSYLEENGAKSTAAYYNLQLGSVYSCKFKFFKELNKKGETE